MYRIVQIICPSRCHWPHSDGRVASRLLANAVPWRKVLAMRCYRMVVRVTIQKKRSFRSCEASFLCRAAWFLAAHQPSVNVGLRQGQYYRAMSRAYALNEPRRYRSYRHLRRGRYFLLEDGPKLRRRRFLRNNICHLRQMTLRFTGCLGTWVPMVDLVR